VTGIIAPLLTTLDRFLIGSIVGPKAVTAYQVPYSLALQVIVLPWSVSTTLFPRFSATPDEESDRLMNEAIRALKVILTPMIIAGILIMEPFLTWWVGSELAREGAYVGEIIALGLWFNGLAVIPFARLQGQGRPDLVAKCHLAEFIPYVAFLGFALYAWGLVGAALAWSLRMAVDAILLFWMCGIGSRHFVASLPPLLLLGIGGAAVFGFPHGSILRWSVGGIAMLGSLAWAWWAAPDSVRRLVGEGYQLLPRLPKT
jgi:O-antigen/teichoic acid export membrane protein